MERLIGFPPIVAKEPRILILGSLPSVVSLEKQEYYGFSHNRFWKIMSKFSSKEFVSYEDKIQMLNDYKIALWDVIYSCEREGSLDSKIKNSICNPIDEFIQSNPSITYILCNGKKAYELLMKSFPTLSCEVISMGSTSNANRSIKEERLIENWLESLHEVLDEMED